jgi:ParB family chromosome partitioning protein
MKGLSHLENKLSIDTLLGRNNILVIIPHAHKEQTGEDISPMAILGHSLASQLHCYTIINAKYKHSLIDMADVRAVRKRKKVTDDFLERIKQFKDEISENDRLPLIIIIESADAGSQPGADIVFGYGQGERGRPDRPHRPTISPSLLSKIRIAAEDQQFRTELADTATDKTGRESYSLNQLFRQKNYADGFYDPTVRSIILTLAPDIIASKQEAARTAAKLCTALATFAEPMSLVRQISMETIDTISKQDLRYIFRVHGENRYNDMIREAYIDELSRSIKRNGLLHPLVLLQKIDGRYKILCGFRRYQAIKQLNWQWVEAKVYSEEDFTTEDFFNISLAENTKRRNLNPIEIGNFLESASQNMGLNNARLADQFGETLGIGNPGKKVSQSTIHKYRKLNQIRERKESPEMISDVINDKLPFTIAAEILAPIKNASDRDSLYLEIIKPLAPTRPQLLQINKLLAGYHSHLGAAVRNRQVQKALEKACQAKQKASTFIRLLQQQKNDHPQKLKKAFDDRVKTLRKNIFGKNANKQDFNITPSSKAGKRELTLHVRFKEQTTEQTLNRLQELLDDKKQLDDLLHLIK